MHIYTSLYHFSIPFCIKIDCLGTDNLGLRTSFLLLTYIILYSYTGSYSQAFCCSFHYTNFGCLTPILSLLISQLGLYCTPANYYEKWKRCLSGVLIVPV